jgi:hypothetical protein
MTTIGCSSENTMSTEALCRSSIFSFSNPRRTTTSNVIKPAAKAASSQFRSSSYLRSLWLNASRVGQRIAGRADDEMLRPQERRVERDLVRRKIHFRLDRRIEPGLTHVGHDADHRQPRRLGEPIPDAPADGILIRPVRSRELLVDDDGKRRGVVIALVEMASADE